MTPGCIDTPACTSKIAANKGLVNLVVCSLTLCFGGGG